MIISPPYIPDNLSLERVSGKARIKGFAGLNFFPYLKYSNTQSSGTNGGTATTGAWTKIPINTEDQDTGSIGSIASNQITLPAGTYLCRGSAPLYAVNSGQSRLQNVTDAATLLIGSVMFENAAASTPPSEIFGLFTLAATKTLEYQYNVGGTSVTQGNGRSGSFGTEVYATIEFIKVA